MEAGQFAYSPAEITANQGDTITIELVSTDVVHGFYLDAYGVSVIADRFVSLPLQFHHGFCRTLSMDLKSLKTGKASTCYGFGFSGFLGPPGFFGFGLPLSLLPFSFLPLSLLSFGAGCTLKIF